jgi:hypothetical protein
MQFLSKGIVHRADDLGTCDILIVSIYLCVCVYVCVCVCVYFPTNLFLNWPSASQPSSYHLCRKVNNTIWYLHGEQLVCIFQGTNLTIKQSTSLQPFMVAKFLWVLEDNPSGKILALESAQCCP